MRSDTIAVLGGTFDPPHIGHLAVAHGVREAVGFDEVRLMVSGDPWQKRARRPTEASIRVELVESALEDCAAWEIDGLVLDTREVARSGATYSFDTVSELTAEFPGRDVVLVLGADALGGLPTWHRAAELARMVTVLAVARPGHDLVAPDGWTIERVAAPELAISSTEIRASVAAGRSPHFLTTPRVVESIRARQLYVTADGRDVAKETMDD